MLGQRSIMRKGLVKYSKANGITAMRKHIDMAHPHLVSLRVAQVGQTAKVEHNRQASKKRLLPSGSSITTFFGSMNPYKKMDQQHIHFTEDLVWYLAKGYRPLSTVENPWFRRLVLRQAPRVVFPSRKQLVEDALPAMVTKTMDRYVLPSLASSVTASASFDLWMSRGGVDTFALVINFLSDKWIPVHVTVGLFEVSDTSGGAMALQMKALLDSFGLTQRILAFVKDEGGNLGTMAGALRSIVSCDPLQITTVFEGTFFGHVAPLP